MPKRQSKPFRGWAVFEPGGHPVFGTYESTASGARKAMAHPSNIPWKEFADIGYRVARVEVREIGTGE